MILCTTVGIEPSLRCYEICVLAYRCEALMVWEREKAREERTMRLIDADVSIEKIKSLPIELDAETIQRCIEVLSNMSSADRPRGEWINIDTKLFRVQCSACRVWSDVVGNYCPWCGAEMKGARCKR